MSVNEEQDGQPISFRNDLIDVLIPPRKFKLAEAGDVSLIVHGSDMGKVSTIQIQYSGDDEANFEIVEGSNVELPIQHRADGTAYIKIVPLLLGKLELRISGSFSGGAMFMKRAKIEVEAPERKPERLILGDPSVDEGVLLLFLHGHPGKEALKVKADYGNGIMPIPINPSALKFRIVYRESTPALDIDSSSGILTPRHPGHALIEISYGGLTRSTCVVVNEKYNVGLVNYDHSHCEELYRPQDGQKPSKF